MSNPRDDRGNVQVDFVWGNIPMQPDDERGDNTLDPALDNHIIATSGYEGFPGFITGAPYDDTIQNTEVPNVVGQTASNASGILTGAGFNTSYSTTSVGATSQNNDTVKSQNPSAGTLVNVGSTVDYVVYHYAVATTGPISGFSRNIPPLTGWALNGNQSIMFLTGRTVRPTIGDYITVSGSSDSSHNVVWLVSDIANDDTYNTGGTAVKVTLNSGTITQDTSSGGTWTKN